MRRKPSGGKGLLTPERVKLMRSWAHSGFNVNASVRIGAGDAAGRENLARYLIRAPFSIDKIRYDPKAQSVICILEHLSLWGEARPPPALPAAARAPVEFEYLPWVE